MAAGASEVSAVAKGTRSFPFDYVLEKRGEAWLGGHRYLLESEVWKHRIACCPVCCSLIKTPIHWANLDTKKSESTGWYKGHQFIVLKEDEEVEDGGIAVGAPYCIHDVSKCPACKAIMPSREGL